MKSIRLILASLLFAVISFGAQAVDFAYDSVLDDAFTGNILKSDTYKCALVGAGYTANLGTHTRWSDVQANEITGTGYTAGGNTVVPTFTNDTTNHRLVITFPQTTWPASTLSAPQAVCYKSTGTASTSPLLLHNDFAATVTTTNGTFTLAASTITYNTPQ